jgi:hypothetical protein
MLILVMFMKLEDQVCSLELAKKLKELGVKQESLFRWNEGDGIEDRLEYIPAFSNKTHELVSAFTVAELGEMLPYSLDIGYPTSYLHTVKIEDHSYRCCYVNDVGVVARAGFRLQFVDTEADARAKCLIYLIENKLITL